MIFKLSVADGMWSVVSWLRLIVACLPTKDKMNA
jgi:hypothetical protein